jgi:hypothetical protein
MLALDRKTQANVTMGVKNVLLFGNLATLYKLQMFVLSNEVEGCPRVQRIPETTKITKISTSLGGTPAEIMRRFVKACMVTALPLHQPARHKFFVIHVPRMW